MAKDSSDVNPIDTEFSERQRRLMVWRDYFKLLKSGVKVQKKGSKADKIDTWLDVIITEIGSDVMHLQCDQPEYCRWGDAKDLTQIETNIDVSDDTHSDDPCNNGEDNYS